MSANPPTSCAKISARTVRDRLDHQFIKFHLKNVPCALAIAPGTLSWLHVSATSRPFRESNPTAASRAISAISLDERDPTPSILPKTCPYASPKFFPCQCNIEAALTRSLNCD